MKHIYFLIGLIALGLFFAWPVHKNYNSKWKINSDMAALLANSNSGMNDEILVGINSILHNFDVDEKVEDTLKLKKSIMYLQSAEKSLAKIQELFTVTKIEDKSHNYLTYMLARSLVNDYERCKEIIDSINYVGDNDFNFNFYYVKGCLYFRYFDLLSNPQNKSENFSLALESFKNALKYKPKDINTEINIELLLQKAKNGGMGQGKSKGKEDLETIVQPLIGKGDGKGKY